MQFEQRTTPTDYKAFSLGPVERFMPASLAAKGGVGTVHAWVHRKRGDQIVSACSADAQLLAVLILKRGVRRRMRCAALCGGAECTKVAVLLQGGCAVLYCVLLPPPPGRRDILLLPAFPKRTSPCLSLIPQTLTPRAPVRRSTSGWVMLPGTRGICRIDFPASRWT